MSSSFQNPLKNSMHQESIQETSPPKTHQESQQSLKSKASRSLIPPSLIMQLINFIEQNLEAKISKIEKLKQKNVQTLTNVSVMFENVRMRALEEYKCSFSEADSSFQARSEEDIGEGIKRYFQYVRTQTQSAASSNDISGRNPTQRGCLLQSSEMSEIAKFSNEALQMEPQPAPRRSRSPWKDGEKEKSEFWRKSLNFKRTRSKPLLTGPTLMSSNSTPYVGILSSNLKNSSQVMVANPHTTSPHMPILRSSSKASESRKQPKRAPRGHLNHHEGSSGSEEAERKNFKNLEKEEEEVYFQDSKYVRVFEEGSRTTKINHYGEEMTLHRESRMRSVSTGKVGRRGSKSKQRQPKRWEILYQIGVERANFNKSLKKESITPKSKGMVFGAPGDSDPHEKSQHKRAAWKEVGRATANQNLHRSSGINTAKKSRRNISTSVKKSPAVKRTILRNQRRCLSRNTSHQKAKNSQNQSRPLTQKNSDLRIAIPKKKTPKQVLKEKSAKFGKNKPSGKVSITSLSRAVKKAVRGHREPSGRSLLTQSNPTFSKKGHKVETFQEKVKDLLEHLTPREFSEPHHESVHVQIDDADETKNYFVGLLNSFNPKSAREKSKASNTSINDFNNSGAYSEVLLEGGAGRAVREAASHQRSQSDYQAASETLLSLYKEGDEEDGVKRRSRKPRKKKGLVFDLSSSSHQLGSGCNQENGPSKDAGLQRLNSNNSSQNHHNGLQQTPVDLKDARECSHTGYKESPSSSQKESKSRVSNLPTQLNSSNLSSHSPHERNFTRSKDSAGAACLQKAIFEPSEMDSSKDFLSFRDEPMLSVDDQDRKVSDSQRLDSKRVESEDFEYPFSQSEHHRNMFYRELNLNTSNQTVSVSSRFNYTSTSSNPFSLQNTLRDIDPASRRENKSCRRHANSHSNHRLLTRSHIHDPFNISNEIKEEALLENETDPLYSDSQNFSPKSNNSSYINSFNLCYSHSNRFSNRLRNEVLRIKEEKSSSLRSCESGSRGSEPSNKLKQMSSEINLLDQSLKTGGDTMSSQNYNTLQKEFLEISLGQTKSTATGGDSSAETMKEYLGLEDIKGYLLASTGNSSLYIEEDGKENVEVNQLNNLNNRGTMSSSEGGEGVGAGEKVGRGKAGAGDGVEVMKKKGGLTPETLIKSVSLR